MGERTGRSSDLPVLFLVPTIACMPLLPLSAAAQCDVQTDLACATGPVEGDAGSGASQAFSRGTIAVRAYLGLSASEASPVLPGLDDGLPFGVGITASPRASWLVAFDLTWTGWSRSFPTEDAPSLGPLLSVNDRVDLGTSALTAGLRLSLPPTAPVRPYAATGLGWVHHRARLDGRLFYIPGTVAESTSNDWAVYWGGGVDTRFGAWGVSVDYRRMDTWAAFSDPFDIPRVNLGASSLSVGASWWPGG